MKPDEIVFEVREDKVDGGYLARALERDQTDCMRKALQWAAFGVVATVVFYGFAYWSFSLQESTAPITIVAYAVRILCWPMEIATGLMGYFSLYPHFGHSPESLGYRIGYFFSLFPVAFLAFP